MPSIVGSVVECSPATRAARVRFPDDARKFAFCLSHSAAALSFSVIVETLHNKIFIFYMYSLDKITDKITHN